MLTLHRDEAHLSGEISLSGMSPIDCCIGRISGLDIKVRHTSAVRPFSIITVCGAWFSPIVIPEYQFSCSLNASRKP